MDGEREPQAHTNKVSGQTLEILTKELDSCDWVEKEGNEEISMADRTKLKPLVRGLFEEVEVSTTE